MFKQDNTGNAWLSLHNTATQDSQALNVTKKVFDAYLRGKNGHGAQR